MYRIDIFVKYAIMFLAGSETYVNQTSELVHIFVGGEEIVTTPIHYITGALRQLVARLRFLLGQFDYVQKAVGFGVEKLAHFHITAVQIGH